MGQRFEGNALGAARTGFVFLGLVLLAVGLSGTLTGLIGWNVNVSSSAQVGVPLAAAPASKETATPTPFRPSDALGAPPASDAITIPLDGDGIPTPIPALQPTLPAASPPDLLKIPAIQLEAPVVGINASLYQVKGQVIQEWQPPDKFAAGWLAESSLAGQTGNMVLIGHNNIDGDVFGRLIDLQPGDQVEVDAGGVSHLYQIANKLLLAQLGQPLQVRIANAGWLRPTTDERLTLVTCWPPNGNSHRLILVARALTSGTLGTQDPTH
jgi:LPXTG-site transpeptidase (sortase) family protein